MALTSSCDMEQVSRYVLAGEAYVIAASRWATMQLTRPPQQPTLPKRHALTSWQGLSRYLEDTLELSYRLVAKCLAGRLLACLDTFANVCMRS